MKALRFAPLFALSSVLDAITTVHALTHLPERGYVVVERSPVTAAILDHIWGAGPVGVTVLLSLYLFLAMTASLALYSAIYRLVSGAASGKIPKVLKPGFYSLFLFAVHMSVVASNLHAIISAS